MPSNRFKLKTYMQVSVFNAESRHQLTISINGKNIYNEKLEKNKLHKIKLADHFDYGQAGTTKLSIKWNGDQECEDKYLKIYKLVINEQQIPAYSVMIDPIENDYIKNLKSTKDGKATYRKALLYPGSRHGWYGEYNFKFFVGSKQEVQDLNEGSAQHMIGLEGQQILTDTEYLEEWRKAHRV